MYTAEAIHAHLSADHFWRIETYDSLDSTQVRCRSRAGEGEAAGLVILADRQTAGRGRMARTFFSPPGCGLYLSVLLRPILTAADALLLTTAAAVATAEAIEAVTGRCCGIKWVNDLYLDQRKVCGILAESSLTSDGHLGWAIIGIGINLRAPKHGYPADLADIAGAILPHDAPDLRPRLAAALLDRLAPAIEALPNPAHLEAYRARSILIGRRVMLTGEQRTTTVIGIDDTCRLLVRDDDGTTRAISSGEAGARLDGAVLPDA